MFQQKGPKGNITTDSRLLNASLQQSNFFGTTSY